MSFVLASASIFRLNLLKQVDLVPKLIFPCDLDESEHLKELPIAYVKRIAHAKAAHALQHHPEEIILAADTVVVMGRRIFQKPATREEAYQMLQLFSGRRQQAYSCVVVKDKRKTIERLVRTRISFKRLTALDVEEYLKTNQWKKTSGGLCVERFAGKFIKSINGSISNVMGMPLFETCNMLESFGVRSNVVESTC